MALSAIMTSDYSLDRAAGRRVYLDTNVFIYALEGTRDVRSRMVALFEAIDEGDVRAATSELSLAEALVQPYRNQDTELTTAYEQLIASRLYLDCVPVGLPILRSAALLRAESSLRLPDAIHVATALQTGCDWIITGDARLAKASPLSTLLIR